MFEKWKVRSENHRSSVVLLTCYLLLVDVGLRSFISFECPTRCKHRDASWKSKLCQHRQHATVVNSSVTRLCCWRRASECPVAICTSWAWIYVLSYHNNCHPAGEEWCSQYFLCLLIVCTLRSDLLAIFTSPELWASRRLAYDIEPIPLTNFVARLCTFSRYSMSFFRYGDQAWIAYSKIGLTNSFVQYEET